MRLEKLLICESVRQEVSGQLTLVGLFQTDEIVLARAAPESTPVLQGTPVLQSTAVLPMLGFVAVLDQMGGITVMRVQCEVTFGTETVQRSPSIHVERPDPRDPHHNTLHGARYGRAADAGGMKCFCLNHVFAPMAR